MTSKVKNGVVFGVSFVLVAALVLAIFCFVFNGKDETQQAKYRVLQCKGHSYLRVWMRGFGSSFVHDPDCQCHAKRIEEIVSQVEKRLLMKSDKKPVKKPEQSNHQYIIMPTVSEPAK